MNILNSKEAFEAMMAGRKIMCRAAGELMDFDDLDRFPATIFAMPGHEFCIKIETIEVAGTTFTKPLTIDDVHEGQDIYVINTYGPSIYVVEFGKMTCTALIDSINSGYAQRDAENAKLHLQVISKILGHELTGDVRVVRLGDEEKPKKKRSTKTKSDVDQTSEPAGPGNTIPNIEKSVEAETVQPAEKWIDPEELKKQYLLRLHKLTTTEEVMQLRYEINPDNRLSKTQISYLNIAAEQQIAKIEKDAAEQTTTAEEPEPENVQNSTSNDVEEKTLSVDELMRLQKEAEALVQEKKQTAEATEQPIHIFSATKRDQMIEHILNLNTTEALEKYAPAITAAKTSMHPEHHIAVLNAYSKRKVTLDQLDLLSTDGVQEA
ncbi:hypothetical protein HCY58_14925 [Acinetobacter radioresistens]|uniref:hypothetical protein n=1 Tax=Acinetobacter radioresistens TaxID=40216 RepID=UPI00200666D7|nr:hypothetical protein [Acinetobacter radioresistens]MCK4088330.1 hypothetical protein [Acinetobacter radioresistens]